MAARLQPKTPDELPADELPADELPTVELPADELPADELLSSTQPSTRAAASSRLCTPTASPARLTTSSPFVCGTKASFWCVLCAVL